MAENASTLKENIYMKKAIGNTLREILPNPPSGGLPVVFSFAVNLIRSSMRGRR